MRRVEHVMGFPISLRVDDEDVSGGGGGRGLRLAARGRRAVQPLQARQRGVAATTGASWSRDELSADLAEVLGLCEDYRVATGGAFDVRLPGRGLDPCAMVKGWSVQRAAELLAAAGATTVLPQRRR